MNRRVVVLSVVAVQLSISAASRADPIDDLLESLDKRRAATSTISYQLTGTEFVPKGGLFALPDKDHENRVTVAIKIDFKNGWVLKREDTEILFSPQSRFIPFKCGTYYDGVTHKCYYTPTDPSERTAGGYGERGPDMQMCKLKGNDRATCFDMAYHPFFFYHGFLRSRPDTHFGLPLINFNPKKEDFTVVGKDVIGQHACVVMQVRGEVGIIRYWFAPDKAYSVIRSESTSAEGDITSRVNITPKQEPWGWIPQAWDCTSFWESGAVNYFQRRAVTAFAANDVFSKEEFEGNVLTAGQILLDEDRNAYFKADGAGELRPFNPDDPGASSTWLWLLAVNLIVLAVGAAVCAVVLVRRKVYRK
jgi:hypothetical protein